MLDSQSFDFLILGAGYGYSLGLSIVLPWVEVPVTLQKSMTYNIAGQPVHQFDAGHTTGLSFCSGQQQIATVSAT